MSDTHTASDARREPGQYLASGPGVRLMQPRPGQELDGGRSAEVARERSHGRARPRCRLLGLCIEERAPGVVETPARAALFRVRSVVGFRNVESPSYGV